MKWWPNSEGPDSVFICISQTTSQVAQGANSLGTSVPTTANHLLVQRAIDTADLSWGCMLEEAKLNGSSFCTSCGRTSGMPPKTGKSNRRPAFLKTFSTGVASLLYTYRKSYRGSVVGTAWWHVPGRLSCQRTAHVQLQHCFQSNLKFQLDFQTWTEKKAQDKIAAEQ